jgi:hypothetical protein
MRIHFMDVAIHIMEILSLIKDMIYGEPLLMTSMHIMLAVGTLGV